MRFRLLLALTLLVLAVPHAAQAWWNPDWQFRKKIVLNTGPAGVPVASELRQVPILLRLHAGNFAFDQTLENAADLRIVADDDKTPLPFSVEKYDWVNEVAFIWVQLPKLGGADLPPFIWLYYGNPTAKPVADAKAVWDANQTLVFHFGDNEAVPQDATAFADNAASSTASLVAAGQIDAAAHYDGSARTIVAVSPALKLAAKGGFTFSAWVKAEGSQSAILFQQIDGARTLTIALDNDQPVARLMGDDGVVVATPPSARLAPDEWHHLAVTVSDRLAVFIDGTQVATVAAQLPELAGNIALGGAVPAPAPPAAAPNPVAPAPAASPGFKGLLDEVRLANTARSADWIKLEALGEKPDTNLVSLGEDEAAKSGSDYLATISVLAGAVSVDGWIVIALIGLLGFVSGEVAIGKALQLRRTVRANQSFLAGFRGKGADALALAEASGAGAWKDSPLFAIYSAGTAELRQINEARGETGRFNNLSLEVVRAAVDTSLLNEANRINEKMVLLTLAVSGAPFLGLFGTVVGIMITFATIALKGDVNINTIAPGIAAAITATAAGMLVAIPALFGYNVLIIRIKAVITVMETFRDEFLSKIAARYS